MFLSIRKACAPAVDVPWHVSLVSIAKVNIMLKIVSGKAYSKQIVIIK
jgi:hypothetical protein